MACAMCCPQAFLSLFGFVERHCHAVRHKGIAVAVYEQHGAVASCHLPYRRSLFEGPSVSGIAQHACNVHERKLRHSEHLPSAVERTRPIPLCSRSQPQTTVHTAEVLRPTRSSWWRHPSKRHVPPSVTLLPVGGTSALPQPSSAARRVCLSNPSVWRRPRSGRARAGRASVC